MSKKTNKYDTILYGSDPEERIVAVEAGEDGIVEVWSRDKDDNLTSRIEHTEYIVYLSRRNSLLKNLWDDTEMYKLDGGLYYDRLITTTNVRFLSWIRRKSDEGEFYLPRFRNQYLLTSGKTLFKGMGYDDPVRCYFDLEVLTTEGYGFVNSQRDTDIICCVPVLTNRGQLMVLFVDDDDTADEVIGQVGRVLNPDETPWDGQVTYVPCKNEKQLIRKLLRYLRTVDPDVMVNHNIFNFDLAYLQDRIQMHGLEEYWEDLSRDQSGIQRFTVDVKVADKKRQLKVVQIPGRHILDTELMARQFDAVKRDMADYTLKGIMRWLKMPRKSDDMIDGGDITNAWFDGRRAKVIRYAIHDVLDAQMLDRRLGASQFGMTQMLPYPYQDCARMGTGGKSDMMFLRYYYQNDHSIPKPDRIPSYGGGYADIFYFGVIKEPITLADVKSMYPTISIDEGVHPHKDHLGYFQKVAVSLRSYRYTIKDVIDDPKATPVQKSIAEATDAAIKPLLNTITYGYLGSPTGLWNDAKAAARITERGQEIIRTMMKGVIKRKGTPVKLDTDGIAFIDAPGHTGEKESAAFVADLNRDLPEKIKIGVDGRYRGMIGVDKKSYVLIPYDPEVPLKVKGETLRSRRRERFVRTTINLILLEMVNNDDLHITRKKVMDQLEHTESLIRGYKLDASDVAEYEEVKSSLEEYEAAVNLPTGSIGKRNRSGGYEIALSSGREYMPGDRITYFIRKPPMKMKMRPWGIEKVPQRGVQKFKRAVPIENFDPKSIDVDHYVERLHNAAKPLLYLLFDETQITDMGIKLDKKDREKLAYIREHLYPG